MQLYRRFFKRVLDILCSGVALIVLSPVFIIVALLVRIKLGSPVFFKQKRPGKNEKLFNMYKFRTMTDEEDENGELLPDSERLNNFGRLLRSTSLDELPELFNIIKGDMSIIGPRPLAVQYLPYYTNTERKRHNVNPGLTGLAQINGRNNTTWEKRFYYDLKYVDNITFLNDMKIIVLTVIKTIKRSDIGERGVNSPIDFDEYRGRQERNSYEHTR